MSSSSSSNTKNAFLSLFFSLCQTAWWPYRLNHNNAYASIYSTLPRTNPLNFCELRSRELAELENDIVLFLVIGFFQFFFSMKMAVAFIWGSVYFCTMDCFFRILKKALSSLICIGLFSVLVWKTHHDGWFQLIHIKKKLKDEDFHSNWKGKNISFIITNLIFKKY